MAYTPGKTASFENRVALAGQQAMRGEPPVEAPLRLCIEACLPIPQSWSRKKQDEAALGRIQPASRPDLDNYCKAILDGLNGIVWRDDAQVVEIAATKRYSLAPRVDVLVMGARLEKGAQ